MLCGIQDGDSGAHQTRTREAIPVAAPDIIPVRSLNKRVEDSVVSPVPLAPAFDKPTHLPIISPRA